MSDQFISGEEPLPVAQRVSLGVAEVWGRHGLVTREGRVDPHAIADLVYPTIKAAVVTKPSERAKVGVSKAHLMESFFPDVPTPLMSDEDESAEDREVREAVYKKISDEVFRVLSPDPQTGLIQARLASNGGMVLCRTSPKGLGHQLVYVTRDRKCINEDNGMPALRKVQLAIEHAAALTALAVDRVPDEGKWFNRQYNNGVRNARLAGEATVRAALEAGSDDEADGASNDDE